MEIVSDVLQSPILLSEPTLSDEQPGSVRHLEVEFLRCFFHLTTVASLRLEA